MQPRILTRVITFDVESRRILLVRNKRADFWYPPGGGWEYEKENILECCSREVYEETGLHVTVKRFLYLQEFHLEDERIFFETIWLATPVDSAELNDSHTDLDPNGDVEEKGWFAKDELTSLKVFPERLKTTFWENIDRFMNEEDPFLGVMG